MARWDGVGYQSDLAEYYAGKRSSPPRIPDVYMTESFVQGAREQAQVISRLEIKQAIEQAEYQERWAKEMGARMRQVEHRLTPGQKHTIAQALEILESLL